MKIQLSDLIKYDGKEVIWALGKTMTVVRLRIPEDQKKEIIPVFIVEKGLEGGLMKWEEGINFFPLEDAEEAYKLWKESIGETEKAESEKEEFNIM